MPQAERPLAGVRVLVTRPASQAAALMDRVRGAGGEPVAFPTLEIEPLEPDPAQLQRLADSDTLIFVSANAVTHGGAALKHAREQSCERVIAIGRATSGALARAGCSGVIDPGETATSERLLDVPALRDAAGWRVCIVRGQGGRELLKQALAARGASVSYLECYRRRAPEDPDMETLARALESPGNLIVTSTSTAGLGNLLALAPEEHRAALTALPLVVLGTRQRTAAAEAGWTGPVLEAEAGDDHIVRAIATWLDQHR